MAMQDSDFTDTDVSNMGSDEEPPSDSVLDKVVISYEVNAIKYLIKTGKGYDKPGSGDVISIQWTPFTKKTLMWYIFSKENPSFNQLTILQNEIQASLSKTGITSGGELGYNVGIPLIIEETVRTMKIDEVCLVLCDNERNWIDGCEDTRSTGESQKRYEFFRQENRKKKHLLKKLHNNDEERLGHCVAFALHLQKFSKRFALNEKRTILMETVVDAFPGAVAPKIYDTIHYSWHTLDQKAFVEPSWHHSLTKLCEDPVLPNEKIRQALLCMKVGQTCNILLRDVNAQETCTIRVRLDHVFSYDLLFCEGKREQTKCKEINKKKKHQIDPWNLSSYGTHQLRCQEFVPCQKGLKKQLLVEEGCRVVALLSLRSAHEECFGPFHFLDDVTGKCLKASLVSWTLGSNSVPYWMDTIVLTMKPRCRVRVMLEDQSLMLSEAAVIPSLWNTFSETTLFKNYAWTQFNQKDVQEILQWNEIYVSRENCLEDSIETWLNVALAKENLNVTHLFQSKQKTLSQILHQLDITENIEKFHNNQWILKNGGSKQIQYLSAWLCQTKNLAKWTTCDSFLKKNSNVDCFLDIQLIEILDRQPKQWTLNESHRLIWGTVYKLFANYLLQNQYFNLALKYYKKGLQSIRFSPLLDSLEYCDTAQQEIFPKPNITRQDVYTVSLEPIEELYQCIMCNIIQLYLSSKRWIDVIQASKKFFQIKKISKPMYIKALHRLSLAYFHLQNYTESRSILQQCCSLDPKNEKLKKLLNKINVAIRDSMQREKHLFKNIFMKENQRNSLISIKNDTLF
ncbi:uncharacterized protein LOC128884217 isoform X2 [Hylaeus volcanicus]|uniref:uncharacterized protein LOC128884217 isoform X2 n=1 Tax=Hylaeus volcanicus TaxID=313075 RepID=UPI0023B84B4A|nr:uncharacterized protein LOC128884217 isoform X2 [Hylaeus volcanicus]